MDDKGKKHLEKLAEKIAMDLTNIHLGDAVDAHWPFSMNFLAKFSIEDFSSYLNRIFVGIDKEKLHKCLKDRIRFPSKLAQYFYILAGSRAFLQAQERLYLAKALLDSISYLRKDPLCQNGANLLIGFKIPEINLESVKHVDVKKLNFALQSYLELVYTTTMPMGREFHGPYKVGENKKLIVKHYHTLKPDFFKLKDRISMNEVTVYEIYDNQPPQFDFFNHLVFNSGVPIKSFVMCDSRIVGEKEITQLISEIQKVISASLSEDKRMFIRNFTNSLFHSLDGLNNSVLEKEAIARIYKKIELAELTEIKMNPYKNLSKDEVYDRLCNSFYKSFGLIS